MVTTLATIHDYFNSCN